MRRSFRDSLYLKSPGAHLLRKAIRFTLLDPNNKEYDSFLRGLLSVYRKACIASAVQRLKDTGRSVRVAELVDEFSDLCVGRCGDAHGVRKWNSETEHEFDDLVHEASRLMCNEELFTFVLHPEVESTNNEAERSLRSAALDRKTGRTTKTLRGAQRRTILVRVLESLKLRLPEFTLTSVQTEVQSWWGTGESLFSRPARNCGIDPPTESRLNNLIPHPKVV